MNKVELIKLLKSAKYPEDVFNKDVAAQFKNFARLLHPDLNPGDKAAEGGFKILCSFKKLAELKIKAGTYGDRTAIGEPVVLKTKNATYTITELIAQGDLCQVYGAGDIVIKVPRSPVNNDLMANESARLKSMYGHKVAGSLPTMKHIAVLKDSFTLAQGSVNKQVNVFTRIKNSYTLAEVIRAHPKGLPLADAAWMFNRLLAALMVTHEAGLVHGAVLPEHFLIEPETHNGVLIDWSYSVKSGETIKAISTRHKSLYPSEVTSKGKAGFGTDLYMAAKVMMALLSGDVTVQTVPSAPRQVIGLFRACLLGPAQRSSDAFELFEDFKKALQDSFGKPKFRPFVMPKILAAA